MIKLRNISFRTKLMLILLLLSVLSVIVLVSSVYQSGKTGMTNNVFNHLKSVRASKQYQIEHYFQHTSSVVEVLGNNPTMLQAMKDFKAGFDDIEKKKLTTDKPEAFGAYYQSFVNKLSKNLEIKEDVDLYQPFTSVARYLQTAYILDNPNPPGDKHKLLTAPDGTLYSKVHQEHHGYFKKIIEEFGFYDIFLVDLATGNIVYTAYKETDFATNLYSGPYSHSNLAKLAWRLNDNRDIHSATAVDYSFYRPSYGAPASFIGITLTQANETIGALIFQLPVTEIDKIMTGDYAWKEAGLGESGETYLVGGDCTMRSISRFFLEDSLNFENTLVDLGMPTTKIKQMYGIGTTILNLQVKTEACVDALEGNTDTRIIDDYRGVPVLSSYSPLNVAGMKWAILSEIDLAEANHGISDFQRNTFLTLALLIIFLTFLSSWIADRLVIPIVKLKQGIRSLKSGLFEQVEVQGNNEFTELAVQFNSMITELKTNKNEIDAAHLENEKLLYNFIPEVIAKRIQAGETDIIELHDNVSLIIVDIEDFTVLVKDLGEREAMIILNQLVEAFDNAAERHRIEKIRTFGDNFYGSCGLFTPRIDHAKRMLDFSMELKQTLIQFNATHDLDLSLLFGINTGPVTSGIIGKENFNYDLLGTTVNQLFEIRELRMDNEILVTESVYNITKDFFDFELINTPLPYPVYQVKGMHTSVKNLVSQAHY